MGEAIREMLNSYRLSGRFDEAQLISAWEEIAGKPIARRTKKLFVRDKVLFVQLDSPAMRQDFTMHKADVLAVLRRRFGSEIIADIVAM